MSEVVESRLLDDLVPPFAKYSGVESFFGGVPPLSKGVGYGVVVGFGLLFSIFTTVVVFIDKKLKGDKAMTSEHFNTAGRMVKTGLTASVIISQWTWAATLLQSSNVAWQYGVSGPFWYASGATVQILLFGVLAVKLKAVAPSAHTLCEIVNARWGKTAHLTFLFFSFCASIIVTSMLLLGGAATVEALTGMDYKLASFLIPWGVILYTFAGGLKATFIASYLHTAIIFAVLVVFMSIVYIKTYSSDLIYNFLNWTVTYSFDECSQIYSKDPFNSTAESFYDDSTYACGPVPGNNGNSYLTMLSSGGLMFGIINLVGNFGTVFVDQSYWQSAIAARPEAAAKGYLLGGIAWFSIPFSLATSLGLASTALMLPITASEAGAGLVPPAVAVHLLGKAGASLILVMLFMAIVSTGSAESIAVSSLVSYDIYRQYINPEATGKQILMVSRVVIVFFGLFMGLFSILLAAMGLNLGWVYLFMGIVIGSSVIPLWNMMTWKDASGKGAVLAAWCGFFLAVTVWLIFGAASGGKLTVANLGQNKVMLTGNLTAILSSGLIHYVYSKKHPQNYDFAELDKSLKLVENDDSGLTDAEKDPEKLKAINKYIVVRGWALAIFLILVWPLMSIPAGVFSQSYFAFWVLVSILWGFGAAIVITVLPLTESKDDLFDAYDGMQTYAKSFTGMSSVVKEVESAKDLDDEEAPVERKMTIESEPADEDETPVKE